MTEKKPLLVPDEKADRPNRAQRRSKEYREKFDPKTWPVDPKIDRHQTR